MQFPPKPKVCCVPQDYREFYAHFVVAKAHSTDERLVAAFASVPREDYVGDPPWLIWAGLRYISTSDPRLLYQDVVVSLASERGINNGQPTLHSLCLVACAPALGDTVIQVGAGTGYYTAILASLVGATGKVIAYEIEADLAARARENLRHLPNVKVEHASATTGALPEADVIYVCAGATHPHPTWLDALKVGGRLIFPLTPNNGMGVMLLVTRRSEDPFAVRIVSPAGFIPCVGARDDAMSQILTTAMQSRSLMAAKSLHRRTQPDITACCIGDGWWLSTAGPDSS